MKMFNVCINPTNIRDAQLLYTSDMSEKEFDERFDSCDKNAEWVDITPNSLIATVEAESADKACEAVAHNHAYDKRILYAFEIKNAMKNDENHFKKLISNFIHNELESRCDIGGFVEELYCMGFTDEDLIALGYDGLIKSRGDNV